ncbi:MAG: DUF3108 domain-containing protein [Bacteroidales bacterium]|jgi:hypothetical protein|nr:DUF3108 domain-containing protein [Bacteroidales bacterium]
MRKIQLQLVVLVGFMFLAGNCYAQNQTSEKPFQDGEKLVYVARFGFIHAGEATFSLTETSFEGEKVYHARALATTIGLADKIYKVRDIYESYFDFHSGLPYLAIRNISEGNYRYYNEVRYDHPNKRVISQKSGEHEVPENILDMLSTFYFFREAMLNDIQDIGDEIVFDTYFADEIFPLKMRYAGDEIIKTKRGKYHAMKFSPVVEPGRIFDSEDDVTMWISKDKNFVPLQIRIDLIIGSIKCDLSDYSGLKYPLESIE